MFEWVDSIAYDASTNKLRGELLAVLIIVAFLAVWTWVWMIYMWATGAKDKLVVVGPLNMTGRGFKEVPFKEGAVGFPGQDIGYQTVLRDAAQGTGGPATTLVGVRSDSEGFSNPYANTARYLTQATGSHLNELPDMNDFDNRSAIAIGNATASLPILNACGSVLSPADKQRIAMENSLNTPVNRPNYVNDIEGYEPNTAATFSTRNLTLNNQGLVN